MKSIIIDYEFINYIYFTDKVCFLQDEGGKGILLLSSPCDYYFTHLLSDAVFLC